jgi:hypothetical protein
MIANTVQVFHMGIQAYFARRSEENSVSPHAGSAIRPRASLSA